jgi:hypothetical protein
MENWKDRLFEMDALPNEEIDDMLVKSSEAKNHDVGLINPHNGAGLLIREDQSIEAFSDYGLGFRIDPVTQSVSIFAPTIKFFCNKKEEFNWNDEFTYLRNEYKDVIDILEGED